MFVGGLRATVPGRLRRIPLWTSDEDDVGLVTEAAPMRRMTLAFCQRKAMDAIGALQIAGVMRE